MRRPLASRRARLAAGLAFLGGASCGGPAADPELPQAPGTAAVYVLPALPLRAVQEAALPGTLPRDRGIQLGGLFSDLVHANTDPANVFWAMPDRGPNGELASPTRRTFPLPDYAIQIFQLRASGGSLEILRQVPLRTTSGRPLSGLSNLEGVDDVPFNHDGSARLAFDPNGLDSEGLARAPDGSFWIAEEYSPSLLQVGSDGTVRRRLVPAGRGLRGTDYPVEEALPAVYNRRQNNRGFESLALSMDGRVLWTAAQSALELPDRDTGRASRISRILQLDAATGRPTAEYAYAFEPVASFTDGRETSQREMKISGLAYVNSGTLLVLERTDQRAKLYSVDLSGGSNLLGTAYDAVATVPSLESFAPAALAGNALRALPKTLVLDLGQVSGMPNKIEGVAVVDLDLIAVGNDNDFDVDTTRGIGGFDAAGQLLPGSPPSSSRLLLIRLPRPLPLGN